MKPLLRKLLTTPLATLAALTAIGLAPTARAQVVPYSTDSHTLHLYHLDGAAGTGSVADVGSAATLINLIDVQGTGPATLASTAGTGSAGLAGFGSSYHPGPSQTDGHMAGGTGTTTVGSYANATNFCGADKSFTLEAIVKVTSITAGTPGDSTKCMIIGRDGPNGSRGYDLYIDSGKLAFYYYNGSADVIEQTAIPTTGADAWNASFWYHAAVTYDAPTKTIKLYWTKLDGKVTSGADLLSTFVITGNDPTTYGANYFAVGSSARDPKNGGSWDRELPGFVDEVRISDIARAASDMLPLAAVSNPPSAANSLAAGAPATVPADGSTTSTVTVTLRDSGGSPVAGKTVTLASSRPAADTISAASGASSGTGVVTFTVKSSTPGTSTYTATDSSDSVTVTQTASVIFTGAPDAVASTVVAAPSSVPANGSTTSTISVTLKDVNSNPVAGKTVTLASDRGASDTISTASGVSSASGVVTFTVKSATIGTANLTATDTTDSVTVTAPASVSFTAIPPANTASSTVSASPSPVVANASSTSTITVTLLDGSGSPVSGKTVTLASDRGVTDTISAASGASTLAGVVTFTVKSSTAGTPVFTATDTTDSVVLTATATVTFTWPTLVANAGSTKSVATGYPATIGGTPAATGGSGSFTYSWSPATDLSDASAANPSASPSATTTYTLTVTDTVTTLTATSQVTVTFTVPNANLASVDFKQGSGTTCVGDTTLTGTTMKNAVGNTFTGQLGNWNALNIGTYNNGSAVTALLHNGGGTVTTVKLALGLATGLDATSAGNWRCSPNEGSLGGADQLRAESAYLYGAVSTADHYAWAITGLQPGSDYKLTFYGSGANAGTTNVAFLGTAQAVAAVKDSENDWNWTVVTSDATGKISGTLTDPTNNGNAGLFGMQIEGTLPLVPPLVADAGSNKNVNVAVPSVTLGGTPAASGGTPSYTYSWSPTTGLDNPASANPTATPAVTTIYTLTVTDSLSATATSHVTVTCEAAALVASAGSSKSVTPGTPSAVIGGSPTASGGSGVYTYSWSPTTGLDNPALANPTASPTTTTLYTVTVTDSLGTPQATSSVTVTYSVPNAALISLDVVTNGSVPVSGDVVGSSITGQSGPWNALTLDGGPRVALSNLNGGAIGFVFDAATVGYHVQAAGSPYNPGRVLGADDAERAWVTGGEAPVTFKFTGLTVGTSCDLVVFTTGDPLMTVTINGSAHLNPGAILSTTATADANGEIVGTLSCSGAGYAGYAEVCGFQLKVVGPALSAYETWAASNAGGGKANEDSNHDGVPNGVAFFMGVTGPASLPGVVNGKVTWPHVGAVSAFEVQVSTNLVDWVAAPSGVDLSNPAEVVYTLPTGTPGQFCRLSVTP